MAKTIRIGDVEYVKKGAEEMLELFAEFLEVHPEWKGTPEAEMMKNILQNNTRKVFN